MDRSQTMPLAPGREPLFLIGAAIISAFLGVIAAQRPGLGIAILGLVFVIIAFVSATQWWGVLAIMAPVMLGVTITLFGLPTGIFLGGIVLPLAVVWWATGANRPPISSAALGVVLVFLLSGILLAIFRVTDFGLAIAGTLVWAAGVIVGSGWADNHKSLRISLIVLSILALFAVLELAGLDNPWMRILGLEDFSFVQGKRSLSTFGHPYIAGAVFTVAALLAAGIEWQKWSKWIVVSLLIAGAISTVSRSSILGLVAGLLVMFLINSRSRRAAVTAAAVGLTTILALVLGWLPALNESLGNRVVGEQETQTIRLSALNFVGDEFQRDPSSLIVGNGLGSANDYLQGIGTVGGYIVFDNQYVTWIHEYGVVVLLFVSALVILGLLGASPRNREVGLPAFVAALVIIFFGDGMQWPALGFIASASLGFMCAPGRANRD